MAKLAKRTDRHYRWRWIRRGFRATMIMGGLLTGALIGLLWYYNGQIPSIKRIDDYRPALPVEIYDRNGELIARLAEEDRRLVGFDAIPKTVKLAFLAAEDASFYEHYGIDPLGILNAVWRNLKAGRIKGGGSTITQQLAKTLFLTSERTLSRKLKEMLLAFRLEGGLTKDEILFLYLNQIYLGRRSYGIEAASWNYFGHSITQASLAEAALLAGLPQLPSRYAPHRHPGAARIRQRYVLDQMLQNGFVSRNSYNKALSETVVIVPARSRVNRAPYFTEMVRRWIKDRYGSEVLRSGIQVWTTIDLKAQKAAQDAIRFSTFEIERSNGYDGPMTTLSHEQVPGFLAQQQIKLEARWVARHTTMTATVPPGRVLPVSFPADGTLPALIGTRMVRAVVVRKLRSLQSIEVAVGRYRGLLPQAEMVLAASPDFPDRTPLYAPYPRVKNPMSAFAKGDVIHLRLVKPSDPPTRNRSIWGDWNRITHWLQRTGRAYDFFAQLAEPALVQSALVSIEPSSGDLLAIVGGRSWKESQFNRATQARRQVGSAFKPIVYAAAIEYGKAITTIYKDKPLRYENFLDASVWRPQNYEKKYEGDMTLLDALTYSRNTVTIQLANDLGLTRILAYARRFGITSPLPDDLSVSLGSASLRPVEMARVYAVFAHDGLVPRINFVHEVRTRAGEILYSAPRPPGSVTPWRYVDRLPEPDGIARLFASRPDMPREPMRTAKPFAQAISPDTAYIITNALMSVVRRGTGFRARALGRPTGGKTGTTNDNIDSWFCAFVPQLATVVWVGYDKLRPLGDIMTGSRAAAPIWLAYNQVALKGIAIADFPIPEGVVIRKIDPKTGRLAGPFAKKTWDAAFVKGTEPTVAKEEVQDAVEKQQEMDRTLLDELQ